MSEHNFLIPVAKFAEAEGDVIWVQAFPFDTWDHPIFGETTVDRDKAITYKANFDKKIRGQDIATDYEHGEDPAKGRKASGWIREMDVRDDGLYFGVNFTETAKQEIKTGEWKYFSTEISDEWEHPHTKEVHNDVIIGGGLTNRPWVKGMVPINFSELFSEKGGSVSDDTKNEVKEMEHSDPGTGTPPAPKTDEDGSDDKAIQTGSRRDTPPPENKLDAQLREKLGLDADADIVKAVDDMHEEVKPLREAAKAHSEKRQFSEQFPEEAAKLSRLEKKDRENSAKAFSEDYHRFAKKDGEATVRSNMGFSGRTLQAIEETAKKFSEGTASRGDFKDVLDSIAETGLVDYGERGSSRFNEETGNGDPKKAFSEKVEKLKADDKLAHGEAVMAAAEMHPDLFVAYNEAVRSQH